MKRYMNGALVFALMVVLSACGSGGSGTNSDGDTREINGTMATGAVVPANNPLAQVDSDGDGLDDFEDDDDDNDGVDDDFGTARQRGIETIAFTGTGGGKKLTTSADLVIAVPVDDTPLIQEAHIILGHLLCEYVEQQLFPA